jgi:hypothetical protein
MTMPRLTPLALVPLCLALHAAPPGVRPPGPPYPPYTPITTLQAPDRILTQQARWIRNQVWATGPVTEAGTYLIPRSYDVASGYGFLDTDYFSWLLDHNPDYAAYDAAHNTHRLDVPTDHGNDAPIERVLMASGANVYDTASWAVALAAATGCRQFSREDKADFTGALNAYFRFLVSASYPGGLRVYKAFDPDGAMRWSYGESGEDAAHGTDAQGQPLDYRNAFYWQFAPPRWQNPDPHWDPLAPPGAQMNWPGWSVITGEEAWAAFLGPLQAAYTMGQGKPGWSAATSPVNAPALVDNACRALRAVTLMRNSATGGLYRNVRPPDSGDGPQWFATSLENNWCMYTGLGFLEKALLDLQATLMASPRALSFDPAASLAEVRSLRQGLAAFFGNKALVWHAKGEPFGDADAVPYAFFLQGTTGRAEASAGVTDAFATDVQTWGVAAILGDRDLERDLAARYGTHFLYDMLKAAITLGGFRGADGSLEGIGFNAQKPGAPEAQLSGEWTWGAINAAILLADFYGEPARADAARASELLGWARSMIAGVDRLCSHTYNPQQLRDGRDWVGYLYANRRAWIPWGWFANACPSQAATTWAFRVNCGFNAFELGGGDHQRTVKALGLAGR